METEYWLANSESFYHQIFMIVMGSLGGLAYILGVTYKAVNIFVYFIFFPFSFSLFLKKPWKFLILPASFLFFVFPGYESFSHDFFRLCENFLHYVAGIFDSNYVVVSVYLCVFLPVILYLMAIYIKNGVQGIRKVALWLSILSIIYLVLIMPLFPKLLEYAVQIYSTKYE